MVNTVQQALSENIFCMIGFSCESFRIPCRKSSTTAKAEWCVLLYRIKVMRIWLRSSVCQEQKQTAAVKFFDASKPVKKLEFAKVISKCQI